MTPSGAALLDDVESTMTARLEAVLARTPRGADVAAALVRVGVGLDRLATERLAAK